MPIEQIIKKVVAKKIDEEIQSKIDIETEKFHRELTDRKDKYIAEIMNGIRILHEQNQCEYGTNYKIIFENTYRLEK